MRLILNENQEVVSQIDHVKLHRYIVNTISIEFANMVENCYYPKISKNSKVYRDLLYMTRSKESKLMQYSKEKYTGPKAKFRLLHDPYTTLIVLIIQDFLKNKDMSGAESAFHFFALRYYTNILYKMTTPRGSHTKICNPDYFQSALDRLSRNHMFVKQKTIPNSIMYYSNIFFIKNTISFKYYFKRSCINTGVIIFRLLLFVVIFYPEMDSAFKLLATILVVVEISSSFSICTVPYLEVQGLTIQDPDDSSIS